MRTGNADAKVDMWSLGVILYKLLFSNKYPYLDPTEEDYDIHKVFRDIKQNQLTIPSRPKRSEELIQLCKRMLEKNPDKRISWEELFNHPSIRILIDQSASSNEETIGQILNNSMLSQKLQVMAVSKIRIQKILDDDDDNNPDSFDSGSQETHFSKSENESQANSGNKESNLQDR